ncbi:hypothetical protein SEA_PAULODIABOLI_296 [Microbacterium phage PauloDiaboli]|nr:hypothetical protein SEA_PAULODIABOLI_296 [Microbacterium phage PauloDiaboli]QWY84103.1 hypothetical protein SEA_A3WALLY_296 [Microbacterium phage A3Wally]
MNLEEYKAKHSAYDTWAEGCNCARCSKAARENGWKRPKSAPVRPPAPDAELWTSKTGLVREDWRIKHGTKSRIKAGCTCEVCKSAVIRLEWEKLRVAESKKVAKSPVEGVGMSDIGWIILQVQRMAEDKSIPARKRERARWWYQKLTLADYAPATPIVTQSGGRRRSHNGRRQVATDMQWDGTYKRPLIET